jgi:hypothetical protein
VPKHIERGNLRKSKVRARVEHVCGGIKQGAAKQFIRSIDLPKATLRVGLKNMAHNIKRLSHLLSHVPPMHRTASHCIAVLECGILLEKPPKPATNSGETLVCNSEQTDRDH